MRKTVTVRAYLTDGALAILERWGCKKGDADCFVFFDMRKNISEEDFYKRKVNYTRSINGYLRKISKELGIDVSLNTGVARHSYASILKNNAVPIAQISENLGHTSIKTTENYLNSFPSENTKSTAEFLEYLVAGHKTEERP